MGKTRRSFVNPKALMEKIERQQYRCLYSNRELTPQLASLDHIKPVSAGGDHDLENLAVIHCKVNTAKGSLTLDEFVQMCRDVVRTFGMDGDVKQTWSDLLGLAGPPNQKTD